MRDREILVLTNREWNFFLLDLAYFSRAIGTIGLKVIVMIGQI